MWMRVVQHDQDGDHDGCPSDEAHVRPGLSNRNRGIRPAPSRDALRAAPPGKLDFIDLPGLARLCCEETPNNMSMQMPTVRRDPDAAAEVAGAGTGKHGPWSGTSSFAPRSSSSARSGRGA